MVKKFNKNHIRSVCRKIYFYSKNINGWFIIDFIHKLKMEKFSKISTKRYS